MTPTILTQLRQILLDYFDQEELITLCFDLGVDYESLPGAGKANKARDLVAYLQRHGRLPQLLTLGQQERPHVQWPSLPTTSDDSSPGTRLDWGDAPDTAVFFGRQQELNTLTNWLTSDNCRLVAILGMGGIGKSALAAQLAHQVADQFQASNAAFDAVIWRSLRNAPPPAELFAELIRFFTHNSELQPPEEPRQAIAELLNHLRNGRILLILDNLETILHPKNPGDYLDGYHWYGELLRQVGETRHQSCLLLTSREEPTELSKLKGPHLPVRVWDMDGLNEHDGRSILAAKGLHGSEAATTELINRYAGNPLALKLVATTIQEMYLDRIDDFLADGMILFDDIRDVLNQQMRRVLGLEMSILHWLAIYREPVTLPELRGDMITAVSPRTLFESLRSLERRSLIEPGPTGFTLQNVIMEYLTDRLIEHVLDEISGTASPPGPAPKFLLTHPLDSNTALFNSHALIKATAKDYVRASQIRLILKPLSDRLLDYYSTANAVESQLKLILDRLKAECATIANPRLRGGYAGGNIINLLAHMQADLTGYDYANLAIWQAFLRDVDLHAVNFAYADISKTIFTETFPSIFCVALSPDGKLLAMGDYASDIHVWHLADRQKLFTCQGHTRPVWGLAFSPDGSRLYSSSDDETVRVWDATNGRLQQTLTGHTGMIRALALSPDGRYLATPSYDQTIKIWRLETRDWGLAHSPVPSLQSPITLTAHTGYVRAAAFSPDNTLLATGGADKTIRIWRLETGDSNLSISQSLVSSLQSHDGGIFCVAFSPDGQLLASASTDHTIKLWRLETRDSDNLPISSLQSPISTLEGHTNEVHALAFSRDSQLLASCSQDMTIKLWQRIPGTRHYELRTTLLGHTSWVWSLAFSPDGQTLVSGSADQSVKLWDVSEGGDGRCLATWQGRTDWIRSVAFSTDGRYLVSGSADKVARVWDVAAEQVITTLTGHNDQVHAATFSPDGQLVATACWDGNAYLWQTKTGEQLAVLAEHDSTPWSIAFHPNGRLLATGSNDSNIKLWDVATHQSIVTLIDHTAQVYAVAFAPDGRTLASASFDGTVRLWDVQNHNCLATLPGDQGELFTCLAFSPDGKLLASGSRSNVIKLWGLETGDWRLGESPISSLQSPISTLSGHTGWLYALAFSPNGRLLASASGDNTARLWHISSLQSPVSSLTLSGHTSWVHSVAFSPDGQTLATGSGDETIRLWHGETSTLQKVWRAKRPYEGLNLKGVTGLSEAQIATLKALGATT
ncbi:MAG: NACHT domain-containing protein [Ardenticatenaceae bacterium]|nr:NACHT domain-containing protein [Ardenticatenaceae bacterium]